jgi:ABC-type multidrug transport system permease subunit
MKLFLNTQIREGKKHSTVLLTITTIIGILYLIFIIEDFILEPRNLESTSVKLAFFLFLFGYYYSWKNELLAGIIFIFWWAIMWIIGLFIVEHDRGAGVILGLPVFILGILFVLKWFKREN